MARAFEKSRKLWEHPDGGKNTNMARFMQKVNKKRNMNMQSFQDLYAWSIGSDREDFWQDAWNSFGIIHDGGPLEVIESTKRMDQLPRFFQGVRLNYAENMLFTPDPSSKTKRGTTGKEDDKVAVTQAREGGTSIRHFSWFELRRAVGRLASAMQAHGVQKGDRCAVVASNSFDTLCVFLAVTSLGGLFSSSSTDMGTKGVLDRLVQIRPRWLFMDDGSLYNGKPLDLRTKMTEIVHGMSDIEEFQGLVSLPRWDEPVDISEVPKCQKYEEYLRHATTTESRFARVSFQDPFLIVYSSGTTGQPKCIVHGTGGYLLSIYKEGVLHRDVGPDRVMLQYTTTGWIMYLSAVGALMQGARAVLYDGSPFHPSPAAFVKLIGDQRVTNLGTSPPFLARLAASNLAPRKLTDLSSLRSVTSTGMPLPPNLFRWFYSTGFPPQTHLANISGGTDIAGCFAMENPLTPVYDIGGCQGPSLGTAVAVYEPATEGREKVEGKQAENGVPGELVAYKSFPNMPVMFWPGDEKAMQRYRSSYFDRFDNVWAHGDYVQVDPQTQAWIFLGRADGVLNPSGVRFGSAEIYSVIEKGFAKEVMDSIVVGQRRPQDTDERVLLFLKMQPGTLFSQKLVSRIKDTIARECSKRHVAKYVLETPEIPTTVNQKKVELPVKHIVSGRTVTPSGTLLNPRSLDYFYQFAKDEALAKAERGSKL